MTLFRGYADDMPLKNWLEGKIWPLEAKLTEEDVYWGAKLACLEMIKNGVTVFQRHVLAMGSNSDGRERDGGQRIYQRSLY